MGALEDQLYAKRITKRKVLRTNLWFKTKYILKKASNSRILGKRRKRTAINVLSVTTYLPEFDYRFPLQYFQWFEERE